jgi:hypothetical protein
MTKQPTTQPDPPKSASTTPAAKPSGRLVIPPGWKDVTAENLGTFYAFIGGVVPSPDGKPKKK